MANEPTNISESASPPPPVVPPSNLPPIQHTSPTKLPAKVLLFAVLILAIAGTGFVLGKYSSRIASPTPPAKVSPRPTIFPTPISDTTTNWRTYKNDKYSYSIKYPNNWSVTRDESNQPAFKSLVQLTSGALTTLPNFVIQVSTKSYSQLLTSSMKSFQMTDLISTMRSDTLTGAGNSDYFVDIVFQNSGNVFNIQANFTNPPNQGELQQFDQILSTFKFIDQTQSPGTETWKSYTNPTYGFSFKYPSTWSAENYLVEGLGVQGIVTFTAANMDNITYPGVPGLVTVEVWDNPNGLTFEEYEKQHTSKESGLGIGLYQPGGNSFMQDSLSYRVNKANCEPFICDKVLLAQIGGKVIIKISSFLKEDEKSIFDQILSTFRFD